MGTFVPKALELKVSLKRFRPRLWDAALRACLRVVKAHETVGTCCHLSPQGEWLLTTGQDAMRVWDVHDLAPDAQLVAKMTEENDRTRRNGARNAVSYTHLTLPTNREV